MPITSRALVIVRSFASKPTIFANPSYLVGVIVSGMIAFALIKIPLRAAGDPSEPVAIVPDAIRTFERSGRTLPADLRDSRLLDR